MTGKRKSSIPVDKVLIQLNESTVKPPLDPAPCMVMEIKGSIE